ncbi:MAG: pYEATS domain-containing protein [Nitrososphaeraceae archaeon]
MSFLLDRYEEAEKLAVEVYNKTGYMRFGLVSRIIILSALLCQGKVKEFVEYALDILSYIESLPLNFDAVWNFENLQRKVQKAELITPIGRDILITLIALFSHSKSEATRDRKVTIRKVIEGLLKMDASIESLVTIADTIKLQFTNLGHDDNSGGYHWKVCLNFSRDSKISIVRVKYLLPSTFPTSEFLVDEVNDYFTLEGYAWTDFQIKCVIYLHSEQTLTKYRWLDLTSKTSL